ncbi:hypothetical protein HWV62_8643, partial [Athelia sp. TMB]
LSPQWLDSPKGSQSSDIVRPTHKRRQKSFGADSPDVVTTDQIRPDWEAKLAAVRAAVARRANRRIIMRQVGDRLIPVGVTSGRVHALTPEEASQMQADAEQGGSRRSRRHRQNPDLNQLLGQMGLGGQDVEELMMMEAMRLSLLEHEEHQRREAANNQQNGEAAPGSPEPPASTESTPPTESPTPNMSIADDGLASTLTTAAPPPSISTVGPAPPTANAIAIESPRQASTPSNAEPAAPLNNIQREASSPPPFSTLAAAMSATNAATAILSNHSDSGNPTTSTDTAGASTTAIPSPDTGKPIDIPNAPKPNRPTLA